MKRIVLIFGLIAGGVMSLMMILTMLFHQMDFDRGWIIGYTSMVLAFLMVYFGVRSYLDNVSGGAITFGRAFAVGICITLIACACYVATWEVIYRKYLPDFDAKYSAHVIEKARTSGATQARMDAKVRDMAKFREMYRNPFMNVALTFIEPFPVGLLFTLVCAGLLRRKRSVVNAPPSIAGASPVT
jgi:Protein of unknown function (DUF4199)